MSFLPVAQWIEVVRNAPLVSIDLIIQNDEDQVLLGWRNNRPAQNTWFVPGGVVRKAEKLDQAFVRLLGDELGLMPVNVGVRAESFLGVYEHHYPDNFAGDPGFGTHYVVQAHRLSLRKHCEGWQKVEELPKSQHANYCWMSIEDLMQHPDVHPHVKAYFELK